MLGKGRASNISRRDLEELELLNTMNGNYSTLR